MGRTAATAAAQPPGVAFFDFDNTLIRGDVGPAFGRYLFRLRRASRGRLGRGLLWLRYLPFLAWMIVQETLYAVGARRRSAVVRSAYKGLRGVPVADLRMRMAAFVAEEFPAMPFPEMVEIVRGHQAAGRRCVVVTTGMEELVRRCLGHFPPGIHLLGCVLEERRGRLTGRVQGPLYGVDKANIIHAYCAAAGADPRDCWAYSDHWSDKQMLEAVGHPVTVNPRGRLRRLAVRRGWGVLEPR